MSHWQRTYLNIISQCVPQKLLPHKKHLSWISLSILKAIRKRNSLLNKYKRSGNQAILSLYKLTRNRVISELRKAKRAFFKHLQTADDKTFWKLYKTITRRESSIPALQVPNFGLVCNDMERANILNNQISVILITQPHQIVTQIPSTTLTTLTTSIHLTFQRNFYVRRTRCYL